MVPSLKMSQSAAAMQSLELLGCRPPGPFLVLFLSEGLEIARRFVAAP